MVYDISSSFQYGGKTIFVSWCTIRQKSAIPDLPWQQVYTIGDLAGSVPLVYNAVKKSYNLPGGKTESGETIEQTITREMVEECNMRVIEWQPLGYQCCLEPNGARVYQFRVYTKLEKIGEFTHDPGGDIIAHTLVDINDVNRIIDQGDIGACMIQQAKRYFSKPNCARYLCPLPVIFSP